MHGMRKKVSTQRVMNLCLIFRSCFAVTRHDSTDRRDGRDRQHDDEERKCDESDAGRRCAVFGRHAETRTAGRVGLVLVCALSVSYVGTANEEILSMEK